MAPVLLFEDTFDGEVGTINLKDRTPTSGGTWEYVGADNRYRVTALGRAEGNGVSVSVARLAGNLVPVNTNLRIGGDVFREGVDFVGGEIDFYGYVPATAIGSWDFKDCLRFAVQRHSLTEVSLSADWIKAVGEPAPAVQNIAFAGSVVVAPNTGLQVWAQPDEPNGLLYIYAADFDTGANPVLLSTGNLPQELIYHASGDRLTGWATSRAASGLVAFDLYRFQAWDMGSLVTLTGPPCTCLLTVYDDDKLTALWEVATASSHANPYLKEPENYGEQQVDMAAGAASIATISVTVADFPMTPGDQDGGYVTDKLASLGIPNLAGRRCRLIRFDPAGDPVVLADGPAGTPRLSSTYAGISWDIRDTRETERAIRLFDLVGPSAPVPTGSAPTAPSGSGTLYDFEWDLTVSP